MVVATSSLLVIGVAFLLLVYAILFHVQRIRLYKETAKFPGPPNLPFIGSAHYFVGNTQDILNKCQYLLDTYSSPFRVWLAGRLYYVVYEPEQLKTILLSPKTIEKEKVYRFAEPWLGTGLVTAPAAKWKIHRKLINPTFNIHILESFVGIFSAQSEILTKQMDVQVDGGEFDIFHYISLCTLDIICETAMGVPSHAQIQRESAHLTAAKRPFEIVYMRMFKIWLHPDFIFYRTKLGKDLQEAIKYVHGLTDEVIKRKKLALESNKDHENVNDTSSSGKVSRKALLDLLMDLSLEGTTFTDEELREEVDTMILTGNDTTATVNCFVLLMLASHPEIQDKVYEELCEIYGSEDPCATPVKNEDLHRMDYLERVIKETMRTFPVGPLIVRRVDDDLDMGGFTLCKGASVILGIIKTHRNEKLWKDPLTFDPDRFLPEECVKRHPYAYIPFSAGPRNLVWVCGMKYAMMAMKVLLATLVHKYVIKKDKILPIKDIKVKADAIIKPVDPITIRIKRRTQGNNQAG